MGQKKVILGKMRSWQNQSHFKHTLRWGSGWAAAPSECLCVGPNHHALEIALPTSLGYIISRRRGRALNNSVTSQFEKRHTQHRPIVSQRCGNMLKHRCFRLLPDFCTCVCKNIATLNGLSFRFGAAPSSCRHRESVRTLSCSSLDKLLYCS